MQLNKVRETIKRTESPEEKHKTLLKELLQDKRKGDWVLVGEMCGISSKNAEVAFDRVFSKYHKQVVEALTNINDLL